KPAGGSARAARVDDRDRDRAGVRRGAIGDARGPGGRRGGGVVTLTRPAMAVVFAVEAAAFAFLTFALFDRRAHLANPDGVNQWGFRGEARGEREPGEIRVALIGGSAAYEAATPHEDTLAMAMLSQLQEAGRPVRREY